MRTAGVNRWSEGVASVSRCDSALGSIANPMTNAHITVDLNLEESPSLRCRDLACSR